jgi:soluble lytic murein transglycosylase-like protein
LATIIRMLAIVAGVIAAAARPAGAAEPGTQPKAQPEAQSGTPLTARDAALYREIFDLQEHGHWQAADARIGRLDDDLLMGHVRFQRYMHPTAYRARFGELQRWLAAYHDHPGADRVWALARKRGGGALQPSTYQPLRGVGGDSGQGTARLSGAYRGAEATTARRLWSTFRRALWRGHTLTVKEVVLSDTARRVLTRYDHDQMRAALAYAYFIDGRDAWAVKWGKTAVGGSGDRVPLALWAVGLASWRLGDLETAAESFGRLAVAEETSPWLTAAGAYWAARAALRLRQPAEANRLLARAADHPRTFYGLLARRALGLPPPLQWEQADLTAGERAALARSAAGRRALALVQVGRGDEAEAELRGLYGSAAADQREAILHLADAAGLSGLAYRLAAAQRQGDADPAMAEAVVDNALYPVPHWQPTDGWRLDRALIFAFMRQESAFDPRARSYAGAHGLMQVLPSTAAFIANDRRYRRGGRRDLLLPEVNISIGQMYLEHLLQMEDIDNNLFFAAVAYNGGPGNLRRWRRRSDFGDDPLLFIETIPARETRIYVERVLTNFWIYRNRLGQPTPSLDMVASGRWPRYASVEGAALAMAGDTR